LQITDFKASNGWLEKFLIRSNISFKSISGESKEVDLDIINDWKKKLQKICEPYDPRNIFNFDESGLFFKLLPNKTFAFKNETCAGGKKSKERLTLALCVNMLGEFEKVLIVGKSKNLAALKT